MKLIRVNRGTSAEGPTCRWALYVVAATLLLSQLPNGFCAARTWHVVKEGTGDFTVIQEAVDAAAPGDTVLINPGRYLEYAPFDFGALTESTFVVVDKPNITLRGTDRESVIIGPTLNRWVSASAPNGIAMGPSAIDLTIENLTVENMPQGIVIEDRSAIRNLSISGCYIGMSMWANDTVEVESVAFADCAGVGMVCWRDTSNGLFRNLTASGDGTDLLFSGVDGIVIDSAQLLDGAYLRFQQGARGTIRNTQIVGAGIVVLMSEAMLENCRIGPSSTLAVEASESTVTATQCVFTGGELGTFFFRSETIVDMQGNHILHTQLPVVDVRFYAGIGTEINLTNNWWGTTDLELIEGWIVDAKDFPDRGAIVSFEPIATQPLRVVRKSMGALKSAHGDPRRKR